MNFEDITLPPKFIKYEKWHLASLLKDEIPENGIVLLWVSDLRGAGGDAEVLDFSSVRKQLYRLSKLDFELPICDLGDLVSGRNPKDTHYILQEILSTCHNKNAIPVVIGGSNDLSYSLFSALNFQQENINYTQISNIVSLIDDGKELNERNVLNKIFSSKHFSIKNYYHLGYQKHLNEVDSVKLVKEVDFEIIRLAEMMNSTSKCEPYFRKANLVTINADAVESFAEPFSVHPQVNGLNRREICAYMKEIGLSENLKSVGIFNLDIERFGYLNQQLLAQMIWYLIEGINIQHSHPKERHYETFWVMIDDEEYAFKRDTFRGLWYFGDNELIDEFLPCSQDDFDLAKRGVLNSRLYNFLKNG